MKDEHKAIEYILEVQEQFNLKMKELDVSESYNLDIQPTRDVLWTLLGEDEVHFNTEKSKEDLRSGNGLTYVFDIRNILLNDEKYFLALAYNTWCEKEIALFFKNEYIPEEELYD